MSTREYAQAIFDRLTDEQTEQLSAPQKFFAGAVGTALNQMTGE